MTTTLQSLGLTAAVALATLGAVDWGIQQLLPVDHKREVADGIAQLRDSDPEILVVGSSHGRTFHALGQELARATGRDTPLVSIPLENGKLIPYLWLVEHRVRPLLDARTASGSLVHGHLKHFVLLTEWWDSCAQTDGVHWNLPSRAWALRHYVEDVALNGMNAFNRNYVQYQFRQLFGFSRLVRDRTDPGIKDAISRVRAGLPVARTQSEYAATMDSWRRNVERGVNCIGDPGQMEALDGILKYAAGRGLDTTIVLFPRMPGTLTDAAKATTLPRFRELVEARAAAHRARVVDLTWKSTLTDDDFMADFDHVSATGNRKFARWALDNDLAYLIEASQRTRASALEAGRKP